MHLNRLTNARMFEKGSDNTRHVSPVAFINRMTEANEPGKDEPSVVLSK